MIGTIDYLKSIRAKELISLCYFNQTNKTGVYVDQMTLNAIALHVT